MSYVSSRNVFEIAKEHKVPFIVKRNTWEVAEFCVQKIIPKGKYGKAYGVMSTKDGHKEMELQCAGCYQWIFIREGELNN